MRKRFLVCLFILSSIFFFLKIEEQNFSTPIVKKPEIINQRKSSPINKPTTNTLDKKQATTKEKATHKIYQELQEASFVYSEHKKFMNGEKEELKLLEKFSREPYLSLCSEALLKDKNHEDLSKEHAILRIFAIDVLTEYTKKTKDFSLIENTIHQLNNLVQQKNGQKGADYDLSDLVFGWIEAIKPSQLYDNPELLVEHLQYRKELKSYYSTALRYAFSKHVEDSKLRKKFLPVLRG